MVIAPALDKLGLWSPSVEELVLGTAIVESGLTYIRQWGGSPALGLWITSLVTIMGSDYQGIGNIRLN